MRKWFYNLLAVREGEERRTWLMFSYLFLTIASLLIVKPVRNSLFLSYFGIDWLPYAYILVAVVAAIVTNLYFKHAKTLHLHHLIRITLAINIIFLFFFRIVLSINYEAGWVYFAFYAWVAIFGVISTSQFWLLANYVFNSREAKRLFGLIGAGGILGGIFGGYLTNFLAAPFGTPNMLLVAMMFLILCILLLSRIWNISSRPNVTERSSQQKRIAKDSDSEKPVRQLFKNRHLMFMASLVGISVFVANLVDYQYSAVATEYIKDKDQLTAFFGFWLSNLSVISFLVQIFLTGYILKRFGVITSLFFLPTGIGVGALLTLFHPGLASAVLIKLSDGAFKQSINKAGLELLLLPVPTRVKQQGKTFIDVFVDSVATGLGGISLLFLTHQLGVSIQILSIVILLLIGVWVFILIRIRHEYLNSFRMALEKRSIDLENQTINLQDASIVNSLIKILQGKNERQILYVLELVETSISKAFLPHLGELLYSSSTQVRLQILRILRQNELGEFVDKVKSILKDCPFDVKVEAMRYLWTFEKDPRQVDTWIESENLYTRSAALFCGAYTARETPDDICDFKALFNHYIYRCDQSRLSSDHQRFYKLTLAKVLGIAREGSLYSYLTNLLEDPDLKVVEAAIRSAGFTQHPMFIPMLIHHLNTNIVRRDARQALASYGDQIVAPLEGYLENPDVDLRIRLGIPRVLALIGCQDAVNLLMKHLDQNDLALRHEVIRALNRLRNNFPMLKIDHDLVLNRLFSESEKYFKTYTLIKLIKHFDPGERSDSGLYQGKELLYRALHERLEFTMERIFRLLALNYSAQDMYNAYRAVISNRSRTKANAIEFLDNLLEPKLKKMIIPIIEESQPDPEFINNTALPHPPGSSREALKVILQGDDSWLKACTLYLMWRAEIHHPMSLIKKLSVDSDPMVCEMAERVLQQAH
jgi:AAA family ATP:ADP antiporter